MRLDHEPRPPCATSVVTGGPVARSRWSHPRANEMHDALGEIEDVVADVRLLRGKCILVDRALWPDPRTLLPW